MLQFDGQNGRRYSVKVEGRGHDCQHVIEQLQTVATSEMWTE